MNKSWLSRSAWTDAAGTLHIDIPRMLAELDVPDTPENRAAASEHAARILHELLKDHPAVIKITE